MSKLSRALRGATAAMTVGLSAALASPLAGAEPAQPSAIAPPAGPAPAWLVADTVSGRILGAQDSYSPRAPASTIKADRHKPAMATKKAV
jgi:D-alanyl-D-alanine carboxypeptidase (penicillin-binding protein 5/6)